MKTSIVLFGIGGYGNTYVQALTGNGSRTDFSIAGVIDPFARSAAGYAALEKLGVAFFDTPEDFYATHSAELAVISTPIPLHEPHAVYALSHGSHVLLEKPIAATPDSAGRIAKAAVLAEKKLAIGFQWCFDAAMLRLKDDIDSGLLGRPKRMRSLVLWPRDFSYYARGTGWAGKKLDKNGAPIFDSVASNATAHYLENMLWLAGTGYDGASIADMRVETWRANAIETFDTITLNGVLENGVEVTFVASHAIHPEARQEPMFEYEFENAIVRFGGYNQTGDHITAEFTDGQTKNYGRIGNSGSGQAEKLWRMIDVIQNGGDIPCPPSAALCHAEAIATIHRIQPEAFVFDDIRQDEQCAWVPGLDKQLIRCYEERMMLRQVMEVSK